MRGGSARSRHVPSSAARDWDAESNKKADDDGVHDDDDDDDENAYQHQQRKRKYFGEGKKHRYVRYALNVPLRKLGTKKLAALSVVVVCVVFFRCLV